MLSLALAGTLGRRALAFRRADLGAMALMGAAFALFQLGYFSAIARTGVAVATLITICSAPVLVALLSALVLRERPSQRVLTSLVLAVIGTALLVDVQPATLALEGQRTLGYLLALGAAAQLRADGALEPPPRRPLFPFADHYLRVRYQYSDPLAIFAQCRSQRSDFAASVGTPSLLRAYPYRFGLCTIRRRLEDDTGHGLRVSSHC